MMKSCERIFVMIVPAIMLASLPLWSQSGDTTSQQQPVPPLIGTNTSSAQANSNDETINPNNDRMQAPPPVSGQTYPTVLTSQERSNYLRGGLSFTSAYSDNAIGVIDPKGHPLSDVSYSVAPTLALDQTTARLHLILTYAPGFTFYQRNSSRDETDQNAAIDFQYRLSPHVTFSARDGFQKSSNVFNQPDLGSVGGVSGGVQGPNFSVIAPIADRLSNFGNVGLTYQYALNDMIGAGGSFSNLHYPTPTQVPGLYDSSSQGGSAFYSHRISRVHYFGVAYEYQRLMSYPTVSNGETQTHAALLFYSYTPTPRVSLSFFGGPQHTDTIQPPLPPSTTPLPETRSWKPSAGASLAWQGRLSNLAFSYAHTIAGGGGLIGAVQLDSATASVRQQILRTLSATVAGGYTQNDVLGIPNVQSNNGHSISGTASLQQQFGQQVNLQLGYTRLHQVYSNVGVLSATPDTNREFVSLSYQFSKPIGR